MLRRRTNDMQISERELLSMTHDLDEMHQATLPAMHAAIGEWADVQRGAPSRPAVDPVAAAALPLATATGTSRRRFLIGAGAAVGGVLLAACSSSKVAKSVTSTTTGSGGGSKNPYTGDVAIAALAASLENLAVQTYGAGIKAAQAGQLGSVPPAIVTFATVAQSQHMAHAGAWNSILTSAGKPMVTGVDKTVQTAVVTPGFAQVKNATDLAKFALELEDAAAATYLGGIMALASDSNIKIAASIQPVEMQHSAILNFVIGNYPVPASFATTTGARTTSDTIG